MTQIRAVVLDIGEVLLRLDFRRIFRTLELGNDVPLQAALEKLNRWELYDAFERGKVSAADFHTAVCATLKDPVNYDDFVDAWNSVIIHEVEGIGALLEQVKARVPLYALSNSNILHITHCTGKFGWFCHFTRVFSSHELGLRKPEKEIYESVAKQVNLSPAHLLFVDDRQENIDGARVAGYQAEICLNPVADLPRIFKRYQLL